MPSYMEWMDKHADATAAAADELAALRERVAELEARDQHAREVDARSFVRTLELEAERDALRARVAELEANLRAEVMAGHASALHRAERDTALATLERVREALTHSGGEPAIDTLGRIEDALR
jgi:BMFP domain-containing protein YqiC